MIEDYPEELQNKFREFIVKQTMDKVNKDLAEMLYGLDPDKYEIVYQIGKEPRIELK